MTAHAFAIVPAAAPETAPAQPLGGRVAAPDRALLERLRGLARHAQLSSSMGLESACTLIEPGSATAYGEALLRMLAATASRALVFHPREAVEASFDELWLVRLIRCLQARDEASAQLLLGRRVGPVGRRTVGYLALGFAERLDADA